MRVSAYIAILATAVPAVWSLPSGLVTKQFKVPTCAAEKCLASTNGTFIATSAYNGTAPSDLGGLCSLPQDDITRYVQTVQPCIDGPYGEKACTEGAIYRKSFCIAQEMTRH